MEIKVDHKTEACFEEIFHQLRETQENMESVVPDSCEDIAQVASVHCQLYLKEKTVTARGVFANIACECVVFTIPENAQQLSCVRLHKEFCMEFEQEGLQAEDRLQLRLQVMSEEARMINPRKICVDLSVQGEMFGYRASQCETELIIDESEEQLHLQTQDLQQCVLSEVGEKTFTVAEQEPIAFEEGDVEQIVYSSADFHLTDTQRIGSKLLIKGAVALHIVYALQGQHGLKQADHDLPFTQLIELQKEQELHSLILTATGSYLTLSEAINGKKVLSIELHALTQWCFCSQLPRQRLSDAYSNRYALALEKETRELCTSYSREDLTLKTKENISLGDGTELLSYELQAPSVSLRGGKLQAAVVFFALVRREDGLLSAFSRRLTWEETAPSGLENIQAVAVGEPAVLLNGPQAEVGVELIITCGIALRQELDDIVQLSWEEETPLDLSRLPSLTLVRREEGNTWELAKRYHSSPACIETVNKENDSAFLLIPRTR